VAILLGEYAFGKCSNTTPSGRPTRCCQDPTVDYSSNRQESEWTDRKPQRTCVSCWAIDRTKYYDFDLKGKSGLLSFDEPTRLFFPIRPCLMKVLGTIRTSLSCASLKAPNESQNVISRSQDGCVVACEFRSTANSCERWTTRNGAMISTC